MLGIFQCFTISYINYKHSTMDLVKVIISSLKCNKTDKNLHTPEIYYTVQ